MCMEDPPKLCSVKLAIPVEPSEVPVLTSRQPGDPESLKVALPKVLLFRIDRYKDNAVENEIRKHASIMNGV